MKIDLWENLVNFVGIQKRTVLPFSELLNLPVFQWVNFAPGIDARILPCLYPNQLCIECTMKKGSKLDRHGHDYLEGFVIMSGAVRDNVSGVAMKADGKLTSWRKGTEHEPEALEDSRILIYCEL